MTERRPRIPSTLERWARLGLPMFVSACASAAGPPHRTVLDFASPGLAWTAAAVSSASESSSAPRPAAQRLACVTHCASIGRPWAALLAAARRHADLDHAPNWQLDVVQRDDIEAQALPGGRVVLSESFVRRRALTESQIAFVLAHEIAHVLHQHERQLLTAALALLPREVPRTVADVYVEMDFNISLFKSLEVVMQQAELEADETAIYLAALAGYGPSDTLRFLEAEDRHTERDAASFVATHPSAATRLQQARRSLPLALRLAEHARQRRQP
jgi:Zn-dependent protease with chaperone function